MSRKSEHVETRVITSRRHVRMYSVRQPASRGHFPPRQPPRAASSAAPSAVRSAGQREVSRVSSGQSLTSAPGDPATAARWSGFRGRCASEEALRGQRGGLWIRWETGARLVRDRLHKVGGEWAARSTQ